VLAGARRLRARSTARRSAIRGVLVRHSADASHPRARDVGCPCRSAPRRALATSSADAALRRAAAQTEDWDGETRIGASLKEFLDQYGHPGMARGAVVVICSDGLEVGDPELLAAQMDRLHRLAHRVIWLNP